MAREAGGSDMEPYDYGAKPDRMILFYDELVILADKIAAAEREACAKVCDAADKSTHPTDLADAIRARGKA